MSIQVGGRMRRYKILLILIHLVKIKAILNAPTTKKVSISTLRENLPLAEEAAWWDDAGARYVDWLRSTEEELIAENSLRVEGEIPPWLHGRLEHVGPALFEIGDEKFSDWVDGSAMIYQVKIGADGCSYRNRFLDTHNLRAHRSANRINAKEAASRPKSWSWLKRLSSILSPDPQENANLVAGLMAGRSVCASVSCTPIEYDPETLETLGPVQFYDDLGKRPIFFSEPHIHAPSGDWYQLGITLDMDFSLKKAAGLRSNYLLFKVRAADSMSSSVHREVIAEFDSAGEWPAPVHTLAITENYIIVVEVPYIIDISSSLKSELHWLMDSHYEGSLSDYTCWKPHDPVTFHVVSRSTGKRVHRATHPDSFFFFHAVHAYEQESEIILHLSSYTQPPSGFDLKDAHLGAMESWSAGGGRLNRYTIDLNEPLVSSKEVSEVIFDEPALHPIMRYRSDCPSVYGILDGVDNRLGKIDLVTGESTYWADQIRGRHQAWQPVYVPKPDCEDETDAHLLCIVRDLELSTSFLLILDANTLKEKARIWLPTEHHIPMHAHGHFVFSEM